jgi:hypothetical protein
MNLPRSPRDFRRFLLSSPSFHAGLWFLCARRSLAAAAPFSTCLQHRNLRTRTSMLAQVLQIFLWNEHLVKNLLISTLAKVIYFKETILQRSTKPLSTSQNRVEISWKKCPPFSNTLLPAQLPRFLWFTTTNRLLSLVTSTNRAPHPLPPIVSITFVRLSPWGYWTIFVAEFHPRPANGCDWNATHALLLRSTATKLRRVGTGHITIFADFRRFRRFVAIFDDLLRFSPFFANFGLTFDVFIENLILWSLFCINIAVICHFSVKIFWNP